MGDWYWTSSNVFRGICDRYWTSVFLRAWIDRYFNSDCFKRHGWLIFDFSVFRAMGCRFLTSHWFHFQKYGWLIFDFSVFRAMGCWFLTSHWFQSYRWLIFDFSVFKSHGLNCWFLTSHWFQRYGWLIFDFSVFRAMEHANNLKVKRTTSNETKAYRTSIKKKKQFRVAYMYSILPFSHF